MYKRLLNIKPNFSIFLFGPRGTGKSSWLKKEFKNANYIDLLEPEIYIDLLANPQNLKNYILKENEPIIVDEIQKVPMLLDEVHRLIEKYKYKFILTGSSARKLKQSQANLLGGRALNHNMYPLTTLELKKDFDIKKAIRYGMLPTLYNEEVDPDKYLKNYIANYLNEEILQEGLTRNLSSFARFLEVASFSQGQVLNYSEVARESSINRKVVEDYFNILYDLLIAYEIPVFTKKSKRKLISQNKFYFFDVGIYNALKPKGILDVVEENEGVALESLVLQELIGVNGSLELDYKVYYWRTQSKLEIDFILYNDKKLIAIEVKRKKKILSTDLKSLNEFKKDYPIAETYIFYGGKKELNVDGIHVLPLESALKNIDKILK